MFEGTDGCVPSVIYRREFHNYYELFLKFCNLTLIRLSGTPAWRWLLHGHLVVIRAKK